VNIAIVHDYLTQRGGAERVVLSMLTAFPAAPLYTSVYEPAGTYPEFREADVRVLPLNRISLLRRNHRLALPLLAPAFSRLEIDADVVVCSSSGWAHGARVEGRKVVYCYTPARWLYQSEAYLGERASVARVGLSLLRPLLRSWDRRAAATAHRYVTSSSVVRDRIKVLYGLDAEVLPPPPMMSPSGEERPAEGLGPGFLLCVSRLLPYKNVHALVAACADLPEEQLVVVGTGPEGGRLRAAAGDNVRFLGSVPDDLLRWLYSSCAAVVAASYEDYGLTPLEAASFGKPALVLRAGGFLDTVVDGETGLFFDRPEPAAIADAVRSFRGRSWDVDRLRTHAGRYSEERFVARLREIVREEAA
jgi:glycosyltransferase involved in cell wall biosynthesis